VPDAAQEATAPSRQPPLAAALVRASERVLKCLTQPRRAAVWLHLGALAEHAARMGFVGKRGALRMELQQIARVHPQLAELTRFATGMKPKDEQLIAAHWQQQQWWVSIDAFFYGYPLGDLYQALSDEARRQRALCQTPWWVGELLLHLAYDRALEQWRAPRVIDPACGTGHLLVEAFVRSLRALGSARRALKSVHGVDLDPYAVVVARYRLLALASTVVDRASELRSLPLQVATANALLSKTEPLLERGRYEVVLANPPYIVPPDAKERDAIRARYSEVCHMRYSLALPFTALMTELARPGGYIAQLTTNAWQKREYGAPFVEGFLARHELIWVINSGGAYIPGHGTPTCILVHRNLPASGEPVLTVMGKRGEPSTPAEPAEGLVWTSIRHAVYAQEAHARRARFRAPGGNSSGGSEGRGASCVWSGKESGEINR
jgi:SAM-dependent methyltransferase